MARRGCRSGECARTNSPLLQVVLLRVVPERPEAHTQELRRPHLDPSGAAQRFGDVLLLDVLDVLFQVEPVVGEALSCWAAGSSGTAGRLRADLLGQAFRKDRAGPFESDGALDARFRARGRCRASRGPCRCRIASPGHAAQLLAHLLGEAGGEVLGERRDVVAPFAQRRQSQRDDVDAVEQVFAEPPLGDHLGEVAVGGGDDPDVGVDFVGAAEPAELALLQHAQQLHLDHRTHLPDLVEEDGPLLRHFDQPLLVGVGAGERAAHVAEELGIEQRLRQRAAVQRDERPILPRAS